MVRKGSDPSRRFIDCDMADAEALDFASGSLVYFSRKAPGRTGPNEDAGALIPFENGESGVIVIADGVGGHRCAGQAAALAVETLCESIQQAEQIGAEIREGILKGFDTANRKILELGVGAATTLIATEVRKDGTVRCYHVGDSAAMVFGLKGKVKLETIAHSPIGYALESGLVDHQEAMHHVERHFVSNLMGMPDMRIEIGPPMPLETMDTLVVATDGLLDNLTLEEIKENFRKGKLPEVSRDVASLCWKRMTQPEPGAPSKPDDTTFIAYRRSRYGEDR